jgi:Undecaprenyl-phosphate glucose phosphotransferase
MSRVDCLKAQQRDRIVEGRDNPQRVSVNSPEENIIGFLPLIPDVADNKATGDHQVTGHEFSEQIASGLLALADGILIFLSGVSTYLIFPGWGNAADNLACLTLSANIAIIAPVAFKFLHLYAIHPGTFRVLPLARTLTFYALIFLATFTLGLTIGVMAGLSLVWVFSWFIASASLLSLSRFSFKRLICAQTQSGQLTKNIAIFGAGKQGARFINHLKMNKEPWSRIVGIFDDRNNRTSGGIEKYQLRGNLDDLIQFARDRRVDDVLIALPWSAEQRILDILAKLRPLPVRIRLCPDMAGFHFLNHGLSLYAGLPTLNATDKPMDGWKSFLKASEDRVLGAIILILIFPIMVIVAALVKMDSPGPVLFHQKRYGLNNKIISIYKFRTMYVTGQDDNAVTLVTRDDPRVTRLGAFLRRTSLDELPQIFNVLKGEMSIVGPRPHAKMASAAGKSYFDVTDDYIVRHKVKPGITGWAQVNGWRGETDTELKVVKRVEYDLAYIDNWSLMFDLKIIFLTIIAIFRGNNAY